MTVELRFVVVIGERFGRWSVLSGPVTKARAQKYFLCRCDCGRERLVWQADLRSGGSKGCRSCAVAKKNTTHGNTRRGRMTPEYRAWAHMIGRCEDGNDVSFANYGGRGISVCARWRASFANFLDDMGRRPTPGHSIDRKDSNGNYEPGNCRWATALEQGGNKRNNHVLTVGNESLPIAEWSRRTGISAGLILARVARLGWTPERAVSEVPRGR